MVRQCAIRWWLLFPCTMWILSCTAQPTWAPAGLPERCAPVQQVYSPGSDSSDLYIVGRIILDTSAFWYPRNPVMHYTNGSWDTLGYVLWGLIRSIVTYHDTLIIGGDFYIMDGGGLCEGILYWANGTWNPYGDLQHAVDKLRVLDDTLYAVGGFNSADGHPCMGIAKREGGQWLNVGDVQDPDVSFIDVIKYQNQLVAAGVGYLGGIWGVYSFDGVQWAGLGPGTLGGISGVQCLAVYQGDLYVGGQILLQEGNPGQGIMRWDGTAFHPVGAGLQLDLNDFASIFSATCMTVHNSLLWVGGSFNYASGVEAHGVATWDGSHWCGVPGDLVQYQNGGVSSMDFYHDTLFVACGDTADGQYMNKAAKFVGSSYVDSCSAPLGFDLVTEAWTWLILTPNPATTSMSIKYTGPTARTLQIHDILGRTVLQVAYTRNAPLDVSPLAPGTYTLRLFDARGGPVGVGRFVRE